VNPFDWFDIIAGAVSVLFGVGIGRSMRPKPPEPLKPMCTCGHGYGTHDNGKACQAQVKRPNEWNRSSSIELPIGWEHVPCPCVRYDGPSPHVLGLDIEP
jgi:hypothetical protein